MLLFFYGTLQDPDVFKVVTGKELDAKPATLKDHAVFFVEGELYPGLAPAPGAAASGLLASVDQKAMERVHYYEESGKAYELKKAGVQAGETSLEAFVFQPLRDLVLSRKVWYLPVWQKFHKKSFLEEARLFMKACP